MREEVTIKKDDLEAKVSPRAAKAYERHGWTVVDDGSSGEAPPATTPAEQPPAAPQAAPPEQKEG